MKKVCAVLFFSLFLFTGCDVEEMTTLKDISHPYAGEYLCRELSLGGEDMLEKFEYVKLNLAPFGAFELFYRDTLGGEGSYEGDYRVGENEIEFTARQGGKRYVFPYEKGEIYLDLLFGGKLLHAVFSTG